MFMGSVFSLNMLKMNVVISQRPEIWLLSRCWCSISPPLWVLIDNSRFSSSVEMPQTKQLLPLAQRISLNCFLGHTSVSDRLAGGYQRLLPRGYPPTPSWGTSWPVTAWLRGKKACPLLPQVRTNYMTHLFSQTSWWEQNEASLSWEHISAYLPYLHPPLILLLLLLLSWELSSRKSPPQWFPPETLLVWNLT